MGDQRSLFMFYQVAYVRPQRRMQRLDSNAQLGLAFDFVILHHRTGLGFSLIGCANGSSLGASMRGIERF